MMCLHRFGWLLDTPCRRFGTCLAGVTLAVALSCTGVALFVGACVAGSTAFTVAMGEQRPLQLLQVS